MIKDFKDNNILNTYQKNVINNNCLDTIYLLGKKLDGSPYVTDIKIVVKDCVTEKLSEIIPQENSGYEPNLMFDNFTDNLDDIVLYINSGGSGAFGYYYIYSYKNNKFETIFDFEKFNNLFTYNVNYLDNYKVKVINETLNKIYIIDISNKDENYLSDIYFQNGKLKKEISGWVSNLNNLFPLQIPWNKNTSILTIQKIAGLYNADNLGYIATILKYDKGFVTTYNDQYLVIE